MKALLLYPESEWLGKNSYESRQDLIHDLNLDVIFRAASRELSSLTDTKSVGTEDLYIQDVMRKVMLVPLDSKEEVKYRQSMINDALKHQDLIRQIYQISAKACTDIMKHKKSEKERQTKQDVNRGSTTGSYKLLESIVESMEILYSYLEETRSTPERPVLQSFYQRFFQEFPREWMDLLTETVHDQEVFLKGGTIQYIAEIGPGMKQQNFVVHDLIPSDSKRISKPENVPVSGEKWYQRILKNTTIQIKEEKILRESQSVENAIFEFIMKNFEPFMKQMMEFFEQLHFQMAFYQGCIYLNLRMQRFGISYCMPEVLGEEQKNLHFHSLYELSMALLMQKSPVSNSLNARDFWLYVITGANQGGKSTYLRSIGVAQIMMQCGMFVAADSYESRLYDRIFLHFTRREDSMMNSGRLDEELKRMDAIVHNVTGRTLILLNESFASTTEKEGSAIAQDLVRAFYEYGITVCMVTHLLQFANDLYEQHPEHAMFLSAERKADGQRTFRILESAPAATSFGLDMYDEIIEHRL